MQHPVVVVGAGPVGLATAIDLARQGVAVLLLDDGDSHPPGSHVTGSRAICFAKRTLEIFDRLGCGAPIAARGVRWHTGKVFFRDALVYSFDLLAETGHRRPAFVNLPQYDVEAFLLAHAATLPGLDLRWNHRLTGVVQRPDAVELSVATPAGEARLACDYLVAADGARSTIRTLLGHATSGQTFRDRFLIADVRMTADFPAERWFWFDPPFHPGQSVLLHRQPDNLWRIDFQLGWDADPARERTPERVIPRVRALLGPDVPFTLEWVSVYTFACHRMAAFRDHRVLFAGDAAHGVSPFGARGANSGVQDADNLAWKLRLVLHGDAPDALLDSYAREREYAADENIAASTRSTDFITPKSDVSRQFRDAVLDLARDCDFARKLVNSGRLSVPTTLAASPLNTPDEDAFAGGMAPGAPAADAPLRIDGSPGWFLDLIGDSFTVVVFAAAPPAPLPAGLRVLLVQQAGSAGNVIDDEGLFARRYDARPGTTYLLRPDQHVCVRWRAPDAARIAAALHRATGHAATGHASTGHAEDRAPC